MEISEVGVRARARAALAMGGAAAASPPPSPKRRKINHDEERYFSATSSGTAAVMPEVATEERCFSRISDEFPASCCSSNGSVGHDNKRIELLDLEVESAQVETSTCNCGEEIERREMSHRENNSQEVESSSMETNSHRATSTAQNMPTELELEEFFAAAEKDIQKRFQDKYNYDIVKDVPLEGRYEWVELKP